MSIDSEQPLPTTAQHSSPFSITPAVAIQSVAPMSTISELQSDAPQSLPQPSDYNTPPLDPELEADEQILEALRSPKDRLFVLRLGESMESLIQDAHNRTKIELVPTSSYHKLLVHRCAAYYRLTPVTEAGSKVVTLVVVHESRIPLRRIADLVPADDAPCRPFQIMRRTLLHAPRSKASSQTGSGNDDSAAGAGDLSDGDPSEAGSVRGVRKKTLTLSERQAQYEEARSRIFKDLEEKEKQKSQDMSASSSTLSLLSVDSSSVGAASGGGSSSVGESPDDSGSVDRDGEWDSSPKDKKDFTPGHTASVASGAPRSYGPNDSISNGGRSAGYYPTLYDPSAPSGPNSAQPQNNNHPHYQSPVYAVYPYGASSIVSPYGYPFPYPPPPPPNDPSSGHGTMNSAPPISPNESLTSHPSPSDAYNMPPVSYIGPYMWSQSHAPTNAHPLSQTVQASPEYGQIPFHHLPHPHSYAYGGPMTPYPPPPPPHTQSPPSAHPPHGQPRMHIPQLQPQPPQIHPPVHTFQPQPQHPTQFFHPTPRPSQMHGPPSQAQMPLLSLRPHSLGPSPEGYVSGSNPAIAPNHTHTHTNGTNSQPPPVGYEHYAQAPPPPMWMPPHSGSFTYPQPPNSNFLPPRRPAGKFLYDPTADKESSQSHLGPRFPYRRTGGRSATHSNSNANQNINFSGETANRRKNSFGPNYNFNTNFQSQSTSGSSSSISTSSTASQSSMGSSKQIPTTTSTSKHPLPARPDWAVGLKAQPTLHHPQNYLGNPPQRNHHNRFSGPSDSHVQADFPSLQPTDFPPLSLNAESDIISDNIGSGALNRPVLGGAWAAPPTTRAFLGSGANAGVVADGILKGPSSINANGLAMAGTSPGPPATQDTSNVPSRLDEPDRSFERPGLKVGGELFNPNATAPKGVTGNKNLKGRALPNGTGKSKASGGGSSTDVSSTPNAGLIVDVRDDMTASAVLIDRVAALRIGGGKDDGLNDPTILPAS